MIPPESNAGFVAAMEDVLEVYHRSHDPARPVVCLDETSKQLTAETRTRIAATPGHPERYDYEYTRNGTANLFMVFAPLEGWRHVEVTDHHTAIDYAEILQDISDNRFPEAERIVLVQDNLNTTSLLSSTKPFTPKKPAGWSSGSNGTILPNMAVGWIWPSPNSASSRDNVSIGASPTNRP